MDRCQGTEELLKMVSDKQEQLVTQVNDFFDVTFRGDNLQMFASSIKESKSLIVICSFPSSTIGFIWLHFASTNVSWVRDVLRRNPSHDQKGLDK